MRLNFAIAIPVYNHSATVVDIIHECLTVTTHDIIVIDDGSTEPVQEIYLKAHPEHVRITFLRHDVNQGKGAALLTATDFAVKKGWTHLITLDADGQHFPSDIPALVKAAYLHPWSVILGDRQMNTQHVPKSSVFGKAFSNFWVKYETDLNVSDSQSGFRIYPLFHMQMMEFRSRRYDFEVEVLTRMMWKGVEVISVPIQVKYFTPEKRVTHFHKFKDNFRLTVLNTILVTTSLLKRNDSPIKSALAVAVGVFVGCLPLYGLHGLIVALLAFLLRMNFIYLFLGTQISIPPMVPVLIIGARYFSELITGHSPQGFFGFSADWIEGILALALSLSVISGVLVFWIKQLQKTSKNHVAVKSTRGPGILILEYFLKKIGLRFVYFCLYFVVAFYFLFSMKARKASYQFAKVLNKNAGFFSRQKLLWRQLYVFSQILVDRAFQKMAHGKKFTTHEQLGAESFKSALEDSKGLIVLQTHFGGWEMSFNYFQHLKTNKKMNAVMFGAENAFNHSSLNAQRDNKDKLKIEYYNEQAQTGSRLKESLEQGHIVGMMGDRPVGRSFELMPLLGKLALIDTSAMRMSLLCQVKVFTVFCVKRTTYDYDVSMIEISLSQEEAQGLNRDEQIQRMGLNYAHQVEMHVRRHPEQWFNFYPIWSEKLF